jgi:hypothetical protein
MAQLSVVHEPLAAMIMTTICAEERQPDRKFDVANIGPQEFLGSPAVGFGGTDRQENHRENGCFTQLPFRVIRTACGLIHMLDHSAEYSTPRLPIRVNTLAFGTLRPRTSMRFAYRSVTLEDVPEVVALSLGEHVAPVEQERRESVLREFRAFFQMTEPPSLLLEIIGADGKATIGASVVTLFVHDWVYEELSRAEAPYPNPKLLGWYRRGRNPFLTTEELARANSGEGANMLAVGFNWDSRLDECLAAEVRHTALQRFADRHAGHNLKRVFAETCNGVLYRGCLEVGYRLVNSYDSWAREVGSLDNPDRPMFMCATREDVFSTVNSFLIRLFQYQRPVLRFSVAQQELLTLAVSGYSDLEAARILSIGLDAVKARWKSIYARVDRTYPGFLPDGGSAGRGPEKRPILLAHLRDRPEELRPHIWEASTVEQ